MRVQLPDAVYLDGYPALAVLILVIMVLRVPAGAGTPVLPRPELRFRSSVKMNAVALW